MHFLLTTTGTFDSSDIPIIQPAAKQLNALQRWWESLNWETIIGLFIQKVLMVLFIIVLFAVISKIAHFLINRGVRSYGKKNSNEVRINTIKTLIRNITNYTLGFFFIYSILSIVGVPVGSLLAGAGIAGIAIGLGAQGFMNDLITGFFIITEQQIDVGDYIRLINLDVEGTVMLVGLRTLQLRAADGTVHFIPNRNITTISNTSRADMRVLVDVRIVPTEGLEEIKKVIAQANKAIAEEFSENIQNLPTIFGLVDLGNSNYAVRTTMYVRNGCQAQIQEELLSRSIRELSQAGFTIPNSPIVM